MCTLWHFMGILFYFSTFLSSFYFPELHFFLFPTLQKCFTHALKGEKQSATLIRGNYLRAQHKICDIWGWEALRRLVPWPFTEEESGKIWNETANSKTSSSYSSRNRRNGKIGNMIMRWNMLFHLLSGRHINYINEREQGRKKTWMTHLIVPREHQLSLFLPSYLCEYL